MCLFCCYQFWCIGVGRVHGDTLECSTLSKKPKKSKKCWQKNFIPRPCKRPPVKARRPRASRRPPAGSRRPPADPGVEKNAGSLKKNRKTKQKNHPTNSPFNPRIYPLYQATTSPLSIPNPNSILIYIHTPPNLFPHTYNS